MGARQPVDVCGQPIVDLVQKVPLVGNEDPIQWDPGANVVGAPSW